MNKLSILFTAALLGLFITACDELNENEENGERVREIAVETITLTADRFDDFIRLTGSVEAVSDAVISAEASGQVLRIAERGQRVNRNGLIASLDDRMLEANVRAARAGFDFAEETLQRLEPLYADSIVSVQDYRAALTERDARRAQLDQAEKALQDAEIRAPFSGRIEERMVRTGELINPGMPVVRLVNTDRVRIRAGVPERYSAEIREGSEAIVSLRSYGGGEVNSAVTFAGSVIDPDRRTYTVEIEMENPDGLIKPEMVVNLRLKRRAIEDALIIPRTAIIRDEGSENIFVAREENGHLVAALTEIRTGTATGSLIEVLEGLQEGDQVIVSGMSALSVGDRLNVLRNENSAERFSRLNSGSNGMAQAR
ncbi:membrane fusion protein, multidrug efflux system [Cyclonatronum proteinivorum]|uniref:Membrane fusion protein, multidrug efflux system n=1 Tax=Cyclonatronum proteinivorum TaxID=1457365 RepID=A0A345UH96_9BACT|nr:efflux RND transporter periplasmic adaptor subunit [Cyclonatronum proteinivorum]AXI99847.1 membrane fusion protein, multidrug efflux system [Cyclonatronum proteinivorum]